MASSRGGAGRASAAGGRGGTAGQDGNVNLQENAAKGKDACNC